QLVDVVLAVAQPLLHTGGEGLVPESPPPLPVVETLRLPTGLGDAGADALDTPLRLNRRHGGGGVNGIGQIDYRTNSTSGAVEALYLVLQDRPNLRQIRLDSGAVNLGEAVEQADRLRQFGTHPPGCLNDGVVLLHQVAVVPDRLVMEHPVP